jgi:hypothetical protein
MLKGAFPKADIVWLFNTHPINFPNQQFNLIKKDGPRQERLYFIPIYRFHLCSQRLYDLLIFFQIFFFFFRFVKYFLTE